MDLYPYLVPGLRANRTVTINLREPWTLPARNSGAASRKARGVGSRVNGLQDTSSYGMHSAKNSIYSFTAL